MTRLDAEILHLWLGGMSATTLLRYARRLGSALADEAAIERLAEAQGFDWRTVREAARDERNRHSMQIAMSMSNEELLDHAVENHGLPPAAADALDRAAAEDDEFAAFMRELYGLGDGA